MSTRIRPPAGGLPITTKRKRLDYKAEMNSTSEARQIVEDDSALSSKEQANQSETAQSFSLPPTPASMHSPSILPSAQMGVGGTGSLHYVHPGTASAMVMQGSSSVPTQVFCFIDFFFPCDFITIFFSPVDLQLMFFFYHFLLAVVA